MSERRWGKELELAILDSAWYELETRGYQDLTIGGIAKRAKTNKNTIYRRWANKPELIFATIQKHNSIQPNNEIPNTGSLRTDLEKLLGQFVPIFNIPPKGTWQKLLPEAILSESGQTETIIEAINGDNRITEVVKKICNKQEIEVNLLEEILMMINL
ncbi:TetR/AcrR family transcriptional regulator [Lentilactobacillus kosonis]|uniref:Transcriptional regulator, TetR family n=1 Tax=Lentilactobacillus kosonis TaxID=2810561 RepID=A0A401FI87_9LACO|nr:helix-turn-helix domain-containing protein [Lentilactobacillus kosonis]GAY71971.1 transcriptional regulator, TetR family [Lentilactobacillus kosonis]